MLCGNNIPYSCGF
uniref:Uncharacterized protein n=1 Tax=Anguilla anguilla TaxID=7936 RepID=A0A0E9XMG2_ANGAN